SAGARLLAKVAALCNDAALSDSETPSAGSGTELALLHMAAEMGFDLAELRNANPRTDVLLRSEQRLYMATEHEVGETTLLAVKGAPHQVLGLCSTVRLANSSRPLTDKDRAAIQAQNEALALEGLRVLGVARGEGLSLQN